MSSIDTIDSRLCTGCGTCVSLCPKSAIKIELNTKKGIYSPKIDDQECINCGICMEVCPGSSVNFRDLNLALFGKQPKTASVGNYINIFMGHATDRAIRHNSASGGLATSLLLFLLDEQLIDGALVTRFSEQNPLEPEVYIARTKEDVLAAAGSKYCPVPLNVGLKSILEEEGKYAVVGLPCHIHGIRKAEIINAKLKKRIIFHIGIFCANSVTYFGTEYFLQKHGIQTTDVKSISYRGKGWPGKIVITLRDGKERIFNRGTSEPSTLRKICFSSSFHYDFMPPRCLLCRDLLCELGDISLGDPWLPDLLKTEKTGESLIISRTDVGEGLLRGAQSKKVIDLAEIDERLLSRAQNYNFKKGCNSRLILLKFFGKPVPEYNVPLENLKFLDCCQMLYYLPSYFSSRKYLWPFIYLVALFRYPTMMCFAVGLKIKDKLLR
ncbi:Coenzyme F420 hydrogenase/dehydrogenase, beta subunit C-terminal domain [Methanoculleus sp.]|uniref:Coenzyme F420 hydrogenase/dehydrogenase, beta subunit C-terminal domain n=1 Tax=Methanoculleus sp. TaxID=90427 RepID=UPI001BD68E4B|nr:Coenzyme F420 hydrogenase/dehydrogenase, beta subunit C-terminal domain [Methanoculleus sp.]